MENYIYPVFDKIIKRETKENILKQNSKTLWFTGLSGSGKTTLATAIEKELFNKGYFCQTLDGDNVRTGINKNLNFTEKDRIENIRRIAEVSKLFCNCGIIVICAFISPTKKIRKMAKDIIGENDFLEIFVNTPLEVCEQRDPKGLYKKARAGEINSFTGVSAPFDIPENPFLSIDNTNPDIDDSVKEILSKVLPKLIYY